MIDKNEDIKDLLNSAQEGNQAAFGRLYTMYSQTIYRFVYFRVSDEQIAEDLTSEIFIKVWKTLPHYVADPKVKFSTWLFTVAKNRVIDHYRTQKKNVDIDAIAESHASTHDQSDQISATFDLDMVRKAMQSLKPEYAMIIDLKYFQEMDYPEIADILEKSEVGVRVLLHRATNALRKKLENKL